MHGEKNVTAALLTQSFPRNSRKHGNEPVSDEFKRDYVADGNGRGHPAETEQIKEEN